LKSIEPAVVVAGVFAVLSSSAMAVFINGVRWLLMISIVDDWLKLLANQVNSYS
jgi:hypothetical protein